MGDGLIQFLFIAIFVIVTMMDGAARKRRKEAQRLGRTPEANRIREADDDLGEVAQSSEGMVPEDLWKEIAALARGDTPTSPRVSPATRDQVSTRDPSSTSDHNSTRDLSFEEGVWTAARQDPPPNRVPGMDPGERVRRSAGRPEQPVAPEPSETRSGDLQSGYEHPDQAATHKEHRVRQLRAERPHEPVLHASEPSTDPTKAPLRRAGESESLLKGVRHGARKSLRDAIVIAEVLNPPVALRDSHREPL
jgi:hypothetical protein